MDGNTWGHYSVLYIVAAVFLVTLLTGCQSFNLFSSDAGQTKPQSQQITPERMRQLFETAYESMSNRDSLRQAYQYLKQIEPRDENARWYRETLSEVCFNYATYSDVSRDSSLLLYDEGRHSALRVLQTRPDVMSFLSSDAMYSPRIVRDTLRYIPVRALYWWSINSLLWLVDEPPVNRVVARNRLENAIKLIELASPDFRYGAVQRLRGLLYTISPDGDLNMAKLAFEKAITNNGAYLENHFLYGRYYGIMLQNRQIFRREMEVVVDATSQYPLEFAELNRLVKIRAQEFLQREESFFTASIKFGQL
ncbi:MAG: TRAP transporter TatT component family protein [Candidatus Marinimicrobia bacterium]|nr:TRAP transporter TatT component family protein [Candidatus Neomarinimicrobiota bacterium]MCF7828355.1 TRAP transporter TatT component family protein [Candidatus Neomarinimicrobiota bacterium]MCF7881052.1 TRAP transporter TatT component family protein [Candidatus Neomarinimicrobiota bacterium]